MTQSLKGKRIAFLATDGVEQSELEQPWHELQKAGAKVELLSWRSGARQHLGRPRRITTLDRLANTAASRPLRSVFSPRSTARS